MALVGVMRVICFQPVVERRSRTADYFSTPDDGLVGTPLQFQLKK